MKRNQTFSPLKCKLIFDRNAVLIFLVDNSLSNVVSISGKLIWNDFFHSNGDTKQHVPFTPDHRLATKQKSVFSSLRVTLHAWLDSQQVSTFCMKMRTSDVRTSHVFNFTIQMKWISNLTSSMFWKTSEGNRRPWNERVVSSLVQFIGISASLLNCFRIRILCKSVAKLVAVNRWLRTSS